MANNASRSLGLVAKTGARGVLGAGQRRIEPVAHRVVRLDLVAVQKALVVLVKLGFQHSQPVKLREKYSRRFGRGSHRILGMLVLPGKKHLMRLVEIQVVEQTKALIKRRARIAGTSAASAGTRRSPGISPLNRTARATGRLLTFIDHVLANRCIVPVFRPLRNLLRA